MAAIWEIEFTLRYKSFEAQMYKIIIKHLKSACNVRTVGLVGFMMDDSHDKFQFPVFHKKTVSLEDLNNDIIYEMEDEWIYYFD